jgi:hypothetical protein
VVVVEVLAAVALEVELVAFEAAVTLLLEEALVVALEVGADVFEVPLVVPLAASKRLLLTLTVPLVEEFFDEVALVAFPLVALALALLEVEVVLVVVTLTTTSIVLL